MDQNLVMLVDDDPMSNTYSTLVVKKQNPNTEVITFNSGMSALNYLRDSTQPKPVIILLDLNMPVMNGWDFMEEYEKLNLDIEVVVVTSSNESEDRNRSKSFSGIIDYFVKPITVDNIKKLFMKSKI
jgi:CheY-like chemotaxis protein